MLENLTDNHYVIDGFFYLSVVSIKVGVRENLRSTITFFKRPLFRQILLIEYTRYKLTGECPSITTAIYNICRVLNQSFIFHIGFLFLVIALSIESNKW